MTPVGQKVRIFLYFDALSKFILLSYLEVCRYLIIQKGLFSKLEDDEVVASSEKELHLIL
jgi:hypothetical protein